MCNILSRLYTVVCCKIVIYMCVDIFFMRYFSHFLLLYIDVYLFRSFFITKLYSSLLFFKIYSKNHYLLFCRKAFISMCFYPERLSIHFFHRKVSMKVPCYITGTRIPDPPFSSFGPSRDYGMDLCLEVYL